MKKKSALIVIFIVLDIFVQTSFTENLTVEIVGDTTVIDDA